MTALLDNEQYSLIEVDDFLDVPTVSIISSIKLAYVYRRNMQNKN
jgi:hypothetical protein